jgi:mono/diheme cytochrome c family protein
MTNVRTVLCLSFLAALQVAVVTTRAQPASPAPAASGFDYELFKSEIQPMFVAKREGLVRCVQCHGRGAGAGGFAIQSPPAGSTAFTDEQTRKNFESTQQVVVPGKPEASRLLMHPLARDAGGDPFHGGGKHWRSKDDAEWRTLARWVNTGKAAAPTSTAALDFEAYRATVEPIFLRERDGPSGKVSCAGCHSGIATRLRLAPPPAAGASWTTEQSRQNFAAAAQLVVAGDPLKSRLLVHPLDAAAGGDPSHSGGKFWKTRDDAEWTALAAWVKAATPAAAGSGTAAPSLDYEYYKTKVQPLFMAKREGLVRCTQCHTRGTGSGFALVPLGAGAKEWTEDQTRKNFAAVSTMVVPGEPSSSRLLTHPLARDAGGDPFHGGGKHWRSQSDPEWQVLATWVKGSAATR